MAKKLRVFIHTWHDNEFVSLKPGDAAPDWVTNPEAFEDDDATEDTGAETPEDADELDALDHGALKEIAGELGLSKKGSADTLRTNIREKRAESVPAGDENETVTGDRATLIEKATELGIDVEDTFTDAEIEMLIEQAQGQ